MSSDEIKLGNSVINDVNFNNPVRCAMGSKCNSFIMDNVYYPTYMNSISVIIYSIRRHME